jgi:hypothetical protein
MYKLPNNIKSPELNVLDKKFSEMFSEQVCRQLRRKFAELAYLYPTPEEFSKYVQKYWYHFENMFKLRGVENSKGNIVHPYVRDEVYNDVIEWFKAMANACKFVVTEGTQATMYLYTDRLACTVESVEYYKNGKCDCVGNPIPKSIVVSKNYYEIVDAINGVCNISKDTIGTSEKYTRRKNGRYYKENCPTAIGEVYVRVGYWDHYIDPMF